SCSCGHATFASKYIDDWAHVAPGTCCVASRHGYPGICGRLRDRGSAGAPSAEHRCPLVWLCLCGYGCHGYQAMLCKRNTCSRASVQGCIIEYGGTPDEDSCTYGLGGQPPRWA